MCDRTRRIQRTKNLNLTERPVACETHCSPRTDSKHELGWVQLPCLSAGLRLSLHLSGSSGAEEVVPNEEHAVIPSYDQVNVSAKIQSSVGICSL